MSAREVPYDQPGTFTPLPPPDGRNAADVQFLAEVMPRVARIMGWGIVNGELQIPIPQNVWEAMDEQERKVSEVYSQRNALAVALAKVTLAHGGRAGRGFDSDNEHDWDPEWRHVVYVEVPGVGQVSWHMGPGDLERLDSLPCYPGKWDGTAHGRVSTWPDRIEFGQRDTVTGDLFEGSGDA